MGALTCPRWIVRRAGQDLGSPRNLQPWSPSQLLLPRAVDKSPGQGIAGSSKQLELSIGMVTLKWQVWLRSDGPPCPVACLTFHTQ